ncbi:MAG: hypothetical protein R3C39_03125 [Dehalococcoidia bacterium]
MPETPEAATTPAMPPEVRDLVEALHATAPLATLAVTGAGSRALAWLLGVGGASRTVLEATVPYAGTSTAAYIGYEPAEFASLEVASALAHAARLRSSVLAPEATVPLLGLGCAAAIATDRTKRGDHRAFVALDAGGGEIATGALNLTKGARDRDAEEDVVSRMILNVLAAASGVEARLELGLLEGERIVAGVLGTEALR